MPRVVDHDQRRRAIAAALFAVTRRDGMAAVSVRSVAAEAGLSVGSMRHTVASQAELVAFAMRVLAERVQERVSASVWDSGLDGQTDVCCELLPLDAERLAEAEVWLELMARARTDPALRPVADEAHTGLRAFSTSVVAQLLRPGTPPDRVSLEAERLHALLDGLAVHGVHHPGAVQPERARALVRAHLASLAGG